jgi:hypothetical protein
MKRINLGRLEKWEQAMNKNISFYFKKKLVTLVMGNEKVCGMVSLSFRWVTFFVSENSILSLNNNSS